MNSSTKLLRTKWALFVACFALFVFPSIQAVAQSDLYNRLSRVERDVQTLSKAVYKGEALPASVGEAIADDQKYRAQMDVQMNDLETQIRDLRGIVEQSQYNVDQLNTRIDTLSAQGYTGSQVGAQVKTNQIQPYQPPIMPQNNQTSGTSPLMTNGENNTVQNLSEVSSPTDMYDRAYAFLKSGDNASAQEAFKGFIDQYPKETLTNNARYWLGETHYVQNDYEKAARIFADAYQKAPKGIKAADNLLKLGLSLSGLGRKDDACVSFAQLDKEFGRTSSAIVRRGEQERSKLDCE